MTREDIIRMARGAGIKNDCDGIWCTADQLERFFKAAYAAGAAAENEACAKVCEEEWNDYCAEPSGYALAVKECAAAIRARGETK